MISNLRKIEFRSLRPLLLLAIFMLVWSGRGQLEFIAQAASAQAAQLAAECTDSSA